MLLHSGAESVTKVINAILTLAVDFHYEVGAFETLNGQSLILPPAPAGAAGMDAGHADEKAARVARQVSALCPLRFQW